MRFFLALFGFFFLIFTCGMAMLVWKVRKRMRAMRDAMQDMNDEAFQRMADKYYYKKKSGQGKVFDEEYFKGDPNRTARHQQESAQQQHTRRTTQTANGVTIIDDRGPKKKIFDKNEGEYVDYVEN